jgi:cell division protein FtsB
MIQPVKKTFKKLLYSKIFLFAAALILIFLVVAFGRESYRKYELSKEINDLEKQILQLESTNQQMANLMDYFKKESYLEKEARLKLNLKKPEEKVVIILERDSLYKEVDNNGNQGDIDIPQDSNFWKWWEYFFQ